MRATRTERHARFAMSARLKELKELREKAEEAEKYLATKQKHDELVEKSLRCVSLPFSLARMCKQSLFGELTRVATSPPPPQGAPACREATPEHHVGKGGDSV
jgi:hypothetical protein